MSQHVVPVSKFRNIFGRANKKQECFEGIPISSNMFENNYSAVNPKFLAVATKQPGCFTVVDVKKTGRQGVFRKILHSGSQLMDLAWNPFDDTMLATAADDGTIKVWSIPTDGLSDKEELTPVRTITVHKKRVSSIVWHPTAANILAAASNDCTASVIDIGAESVEGMLVSQTPLQGDFVFQVVWDWQGERLFTFCKDQHISAFNARTGELIQKGKDPAHELKRSTKIATVGGPHHENLLVSTGFHKQHGAEIRLWSGDNLDECLAFVSCGEGTTCLFPFYDADTNVLFISAKGDSTIRYFEIIDQGAEHGGYAFYPLFQFSGTSGHKALCAMPKRGMDYMGCEVIRFYRLLNSNNMIEPVSFIVPRRAEGFQEDIFPDTPGTKPALTGEEWRGGQSSGPILVPIQEVSTETTQSSLKPIVAGESNGDPKKDEKIKELTEENVDLKKCLRDLEEQNEKLKNALEESSASREVLEEKVANLQIENDQLKSTSGTEKIDAVDSPAAEIKQEAAEE